MDAVCALGEPRHCHLLDQQIRFHHRGRHRLDHHLHPHLPLGLSHLQTHHQRQLQLRRQERPQQRLLKPQHHLVRLFLIQQMFQAGHHWPAHHLRSDQWFPYRQLQPHHGSQQDQNCVAKRVYPDDGGCALVFVLHVLLPQPTIQHRLFLQPKALHDPQLGSGNNRDESPKMPKSHGDFRHSQ